MARKKLSEYTAKSLLLPRLGMENTGVPVSSLDLENPTILLAKISDDTTYVVKVDEGVKGRMKKGLVKLKVAKNNIVAAVQELADKGYTRFVIEPFLSHESSQEKYISLERTRDGITVYYSDRGGIDIESNQDAVQKQVLPYGSYEGYEQIAQFLGVKAAILKELLTAFDQLFISFLEINPLVVIGDNVYFLDLAVEVDSAAEFFVTKGWVASDFVGEIGGTTEEEQAIIDLKAKSQAAFKFDLLNPDGSIWMLLSGGGASIVLADEVYNLGDGKELANYGEYSGNPNQEETYIYTKNVLSLLLKSQATKKVLIIGGGVANFTDIRATFKGVIKALDEYKDKLQEQHVQVFVRRGGPHQAAGLAAMKTFLEKNNLMGEVVGPDVMITQIITEAINTL